jgi:hypothetical protein
MAWTMHSNGSTAAEICYLDIANLTSTVKHTFPSGWTLPTDGDYHGFTGGMDASFAAQNHVVASVYHTQNGSAVTGVMTAWTSDNSTFTDYKINAYYNAYWNTDGAKIPSVYVSSKTPGLVLVGAFTVTGARPPHAFYKSTDYGASYAVTSDPLLGGIGGLSISVHSPWDPARNGDESIFFYSTPTSGLYRTNGASATAIGTPYGGICVSPRNGLSSFAGNANRLLACTSGSSGGESVFLTDNALSGSPTWTRINSSSVSGVAYYCGAIAGDSGSVLYLWGGNVGPAATVALSNDSGATIISQTGNLASFSPGAVQMLMGW